MILHILGSYKLKHGGKLYKVKVDNKKYRILVPESKCGKSEMKFVQEEVEKYELQLTTGV